MRCAAIDGTYPSLSMEACTRLFISGRTLASLLMTRLTVCSETPASAATCLIVTDCRRRAIVSVPRAALSGSGVFAALPDAHPVHFHAFRKILGGNAAKSGGFGPVAADGEIENQVEFAGRTARWQNRWRRSTSRWPPAFRKPLHRWSTRSDLPPRLRRRYGIRRRARRERRPRDWNTHFPAVTRQSAACQEPNFRRQLHIDRIQRPGSRLREYRFRPTAASRRRHSRQASSRRRATCLAPAADGHASRSGHNARRPCRAWSPCQR